MKSKVRLYDAYLPGSRSIVDPRRVVARKMSVLIVSCGLVVSLAGVAAASNARSATSTRVAAKKTVVKPDFAYYVGKNVTFVTGGAPGGSFQSFAAAVAPAMASYLHCSINVEDIQPGATVPAADASANAVPNGLTIGDGNLVQFIASDITHQSTVNYTLKTVEYVGGQGPNSTILLTNKASGITRLTTLLKTPNIRWVLTGGAPQTAELVLAKAYRQPNPTFLSGYPTGAASEEGMLRGDGQVTGLTIAETLSLLEAHQANGILLTSPVSRGASDYAQLSKIPILSTYVAQHQPKSRGGRLALQSLITFESFPADIIQAPNGTPLKYVAALTAAYQSAMKQPSVKNALNFGGFSTQFIPPKTVLKDIDTLTTPKIEALMEPFLLG